MATHRMATSGPREISTFPLQFMVTMPEKRKNTYYEEGDSSSPTSARSSKRNLPKEDLYKFEDPDYMMPVQVREVLHSEGLEKVTLDAALGERELQHKKARYLTQRESQERRYPSRSRSTGRYTNSALPPIRSKHGRSDSEDSSVVDSYNRRQERRNNRARPWMKPTSEHFTLPKLKADATVAMTSSLATKAREDIEKCNTDIERMKWMSQQHEERVLTYAHRHFIPPRIVLVSSKVPRCNSMRKAIKKDKNVMFIVYDFDTWSFDDIIDAITQRLQQYSDGCKAQSILILCQGGVGYAYILKNFVMTPQKLQRPDHQPALEFWTKLGTLMSKLTPEETCIRIMGCSLEADKQGKELMEMLEKLIHPHKVSIESPVEGTEEGKRALKHYFKYRKFLLWRSYDESGSPRIGDGDVVRTWDELAEDADSDS